MIYKIFFTLLVLFTLCVTQSIYSPELLYGDSLVLRWNTNDEEDLGGYNIYCTGPEAGYDSIANLGNVTECDLGRISLHENVPYAMALTAYDVYGNESDFSDQLHLTLDDGIDDFEDNCPDIYNPYQEDDYPSGGNGIGDACENVIVSTPPPPSVHPITNAGATAIVMTPSSVTAMRLVSEGDASLQKTRVLKVKHVMKTMISASNPVLLP